MGEASSNGTAVPERCSSTRTPSGQASCRRPVTRVQVWRTDDGRHVEKLRGFCEHHGAEPFVEAIPVAQYCIAVGHPPIKPDTQMAYVLDLLDRNWNLMRGGAGVGRTAGALVRRGLVERDRVGTRVYYRLSEEGGHARSLLHVRHAYYGPGSNVFNTPELERAS